MKIQVIDCHYLFSDCLINEVKDNIIDYHQGFMLVDNTLYLPYYKALKGEYKLSEQYETTIIDLDDVTKFDCLATYFYKVDTLDVEDVIDLYDACSIVHLFERLLNTVEDIAKEKYDLGYEDGI